MRLFRKLRSLFNPAIEENPEDAYNIWANSYDTQTGNLILDLDKELFENFIRKYSLKGKAILDAGCGTGRHWKNLYHYGPARLVGYDVSEMMLLKLKEKFPEAETMHINSEKLPGLEDNSFDLLISTLALAHISNAVAALTEWNRVVKPGGTVFISDYHPDLIARNGKRTFRSGSKTFAVKSHLHTLEYLRKISSELGWQEMDFQQRLVDEAVRSYYEQKDALSLYKKFEHTPLIYAILFVKK